MYTYIQAFYVALVVKNPPAMKDPQETRVWSLGQEDPLEEEMAIFPAPIFLPGKSHGQRSLVGYSPWDCKKLDMTEHTQNKLNHRIQQNVT